MHLELNEEQNLLKESVAKFCQNELPMEKVHHLAEAGESIPADTWRKIAEQGWLGVMIPEDFGGLGLGVTELALICEEMGRALMPGPFFSAAVLGGPAVAIGGSAKLKKELLEKLATGERRATLALLDQEGQIGAEFLTTKAAKKGTGFVLNGKKWFVPDLKGADVVVVAAKTGRGKDEATLFLVETGAKGVSIEENALTDMTSQSGQLVLKNVEVPAGNVIGKVGKGWKVVDQVLQIANVCLAGECVAASERMLKTTIAYVKERTQFGQPIGSYQAVKHPLANLFAEIESARSAYHYAGWAVDSSNKDARVAVAVARVAATETYRKTTLDCLQAHGGIGFTWEYDLHLFLKRAKHNQYLLGMNADYEEVIASEGLRI